MMQANKDARGETLGKQEGTRQSGRKEKMQVSQRAGATPENEKFRIGNQRG